MKETKTGRKNYQKERLKVYVHHDYDPLSEPVGTSTDPSSPSGRGG